MATAVVTRVPARDPVEENGCTRRPCPRMLHRLCRSGGASHQARSASPPEEVGVRPLTFGADQAAPSIAAWPTRRARPKRSPRRPARSRSSSIARSKMVWSVSGGRGPVSGGRGPTSGRGKGGAEVPRRDVPSRARLSRLCFLQQGPCEFESPALRNESGTRSTGSTAVPKSQARISQPRPNPSVGSGRRSRGCRRRAPGASPRVIAAV